MTTLKRTQPGDIEENADSLNPSKRHTKFNRSPDQETKTNKFESVYEDDEEVYKEVADDNKEGIFYPLEPQEKNEQITTTKFEQQLQKQNANANANDEPESSDSKCDSSSDDEDLADRLTNSQKRKQNKKPDSYPQAQSTALELRWSDDDEIAAYQSANEDKETKNKNKNTKESEQESQKIAWLPTQTVKASDVMKYDQSSYTVLHQFNTEWPCLSFDFIPDQLGAVRTTIPYSVYLVGGTQADPNYRNISGNQRQRNYRTQNQIYFMKLGDIQKTKYDDDATDDNEQNDRHYVNITDDNALMQYRNIQHPSVINRIRICKAGGSGTQNERLVAVSSEDSKVYIYSGKNHILSLDGLCMDIELCHSQVKPLFESKHIDEGYGLAWSKLDQGWLVTGSNAGELRLFKPSNAGFKRERQFKTLKASIEDIEWCPNKRDIFATVGVDKCIRVWDQRGKKEHVARVSNAHSRDINVLSWNPHASHEHLLLTGSDDKTFKVWDLRKLQDNNNKFGKKLKRCNYHYMSGWHLDAITSLEWHPFDSSTAIVSSDDHQISVWDFSLEEDPSENNAGAPLPGGCKLPPQLVFVHAGQQNIKEIHWHPQIPNLVLSTAGSGFHCFQPDNLMQSFDAQFNQLSLLPDSDPYVPKTDANAN